VAHYQFKELSLNSQLVSTGGGKPAFHKEMLEWGWREFSYSKSRQAFIHWQRHCVIPSCRAGINPSLLASFINVICLFFTWFQFFGGLSLDFDLILLLFILLLVVVVVIVIVVILLLSLFVACCFCCANLSEGKYTYLYICTYIHSTWFNATFLPFTYIQLNFLAA